jgi:hypothetical protein
VKKLSLYALLAALLVTVGVALASVDVAGAEAVESEQPAGMMVPF